MGYHEIWCRICTGSSNVGRIRTRDEPKSEAFNSYGENGVPNLYNECTDCFYAEEDYYDDWVTDSEDSEFEPDEDDELEKLEYDSAHESEAETEDVDDADVDVNVDADNDADNDADTINADGDDIDRGGYDGETPESWQRYLDFVTSLSLQTGKILPLPKLNYEDGEPQKYFNLEHIASPNCVHNAGFNGHKISNEEMKGCQTFQVLCFKGENWEPKDDDEEFEKDSKSRVFLSGISDFVASMDGGTMEMFPRRHESGNTKVVNEFSHWDVQPPEQHGMAVHPICLEVYKRAAILKFGEFDINSLMECLFLDIGTQYADPLSSYEAVRRAKDQWWQCVPGDEWLVANPCVMPGLDTLLTSVGSNGSRYIVFEPPRESTESAKELNCFEKLSVELRLHILGYMEPQDAATMRFVTRIFNPLVQPYFYNYIRQDMPWIWEIWCSRSYAGWATTTERELKEKSRYTTPDAVAAMQLSELETTDWCSLYCALKNLKTLPRGLRNRERLWNDCNRILNRIERHRSRGRMGEGVVLSLVRQNGKYELSDEEEDN